MGETRPFGASATTALRRAARGAEIAARFPDWNRIKYARTRRNVAVHRGRPGRKRQCSEQCWLWRRARRRRWRDRGVVSRTRRKRLGNSHRSGWRRRRVSAHVLWRMCDQQPRKAGQLVAERLRYFTAQAVNPAMVAAMATAGRMANRMQGRALSAAAPGGSAGAPGQGHPSGSDGGNSKSRRRIRIWRRRRRRG